jgi:hypothetical protein
MADYRRWGYIEMNGCQSIELDGVCWRPDIGSLQKNKYAMYSSFGDHTEILPKEIFAIDPPNQRKEIKF